MEKEGEKIKYKKLPEDIEREQKAADKKAKKRKLPQTKKERSLRGDLVENAWAKKIPKFRPEDNPSGLLEKTSFATLFPQYREMYLKEIWPQLQQSLKHYKIEADLDLIEGSMTVSTTRNTWDPYAIIKARDIIKLIARSVPYETAMRVIDDDSISCDIIRIGSLVRNKTKFVRRRQRLLGPDGCTLKAIELLTRCYIMVQGTTVAAVGPFKGLARVRQVVEDTMANVHPIYNIKSLMIRRELENNPKMKTESWARFLPKFKTRNVAQKKSKKAKLKTKPYTPFPPPQLPRKVDLALASGEFFLKPEQVRQRKLDERAAKNLEADAARHERREQQYEKPVEAEPSATAGQDSSSGAVDVAALKRKLKKEKRKSQ